MIYSLLQLLLLLTAGELVALVESRNSGCGFCCSFCHYRPSSVAAAAAAAASHSTWSSSLSTVKVESSPSSHYISSAHYKNRRRREWTARSASRAFLTKKERGLGELPSPQQRQQQQERSQWLRKRLGLSQAQLEKATTTAPTLLKLRSETIDEKFNWFQMRLDLTTTKQLAKLFVKTPHSFKLNIRDNLGPKFDLIQNRTECTNMELVRLLEQAPRLSSKKIDKVAGVLDLLETELHLNTAQDLRRFLLRSSGTLLASSPVLLKPRIDWFQRTLQLAADDGGGDFDDVDNAAGKKLAKLLNHHANLLTRDVEKTLEPKVQWLQRRLDANDDEVAYLLRNRICLLKLDVESTIESKLLWLMNRFDLKDVADLKRILLGLPAILSYSHDENIEPKMRFYEELFGDEQLARQFVVNDPRFFSYSLEKRIKPRIEEAKELGMEINTSTLNRIIKATDDRWGKSVSNWKRIALKQLASDGGLW